MKFKNSNFYLPELDGLRFFAFLFVFIHHSNFPVNFTILNSFKNFGWIGVDLFFTLSAFLITSILRREFFVYGKINIKLFYLRRIFRIWPIYFLLIIGSILFLFLQNEKIDNYTLFRLVGLVSFVDNIFCFFFGYNDLPGISHLWTISFEEQFYLIIPFCLLFIVQLDFKRAIKYILVSFVLLMSFRIFIIALRFNHPSIWVIPITHFDSIFFGVIVAIMGKKISFFQKLNYWIQMVIFTICLLLIFILPSTDALSQLVNITYFLVGIICSIILMTSLRVGWLNIMLKKKIFVFLGKRSYAMYLFHLFIIEFSCSLFNNFKLTPNLYLVCFIVSLLLTIFLSMLSYSLIEKPFLLLKKKYEIIYSRPL